MLVSCFNGPKARNVQANYTNGGMGFHRSPIYGRGICSALDGVDTVCIARSLTQNVARHQKAHFAAHCIQ
jgi:hypothetical protein